MGAPRERRQACEEARAVGHHRRTAVRVEQHEGGAGEIVDDRGDGIGERLEHEPEGAHVQRPDASRNARPRLVR